jgi:hypothetical protein
MNGEDSVVIGGYPEEKGRQIGQKIYEMTTILFFLYLFGHYKYFFPVVQRMWQGPLKKKIGRAETDWLGTGPASFSLLYFFQLTKVGYNCRNRWVRRDDRTPDARRERRRADPAIFCPLWAHNPATIVFLFIFLSQRINFFSDRLDLKKTLENGQIIRRL